MAPQRVRAPEDSKSDSSSVKEKHGNIHSFAASSKNRRNGNTHVNSASNLRDVTTISAADNTSSQQNGADAPGVRNSSILPTTDMFILIFHAQILWNTFPLETLRSYRHACRMNTPSAFTSVHNQLVLSQSSIGRNSPTMARRKDKRRVSKEALAMAVRKDFNAVGVNEQDVITQLLYKLQNEGLWRAEHECFVSKKWLTSHQRKLSGLNSSLRGRDKVPTRIRIVQQYTST
jgi:hypothetical protein